MLKSIVNTEQNGVRSLNKYYSPPPFLKNFIRYFWCLEVSEEHETNKVLDVTGSRFPRITFQHLEDCNTMRQGDGTPMPRSSVMGISTEHKKFNMYGRYVHTGVSLQPLGLKVFFGLDASEFTNQWSDLLDLIGNQLNEKIYSAKSDDERILILCRFFEDRLTQNLKYDPDLLSGIILNEFCPSEHGVFIMSKKLKISERQLERKFRSHIGLSPRKYLKLKRFEAANQLLLSSKELSLTEIAYELNYSDQSHFIREFKEFSGLTPGQFIKLNVIAEEGSAFLHLNETN